MSNATVVGSPHAVKGPSDHEQSAKELLARRLNELIEASSLSQADVARRLGMPQPKISAIRNHKLRGISLQRLMQALTSLGQRVEIVVTPCSEPARARIDVAANAAIGH